MPESGLPWAGEGSGARVGMLWALASFPTNLRHFQRDPRGQNGRRALWGRLGRVAAGRAFFSLAWPGLPTDPHYPLLHSGHNPPGSSPAVGLKSAGEVATALAGAWFPWESAPEPSSAILTLPGVSFHPVLETKAAPSHSQVRAEQTLVHPEKPNLAGGCCFGLEVKKTF